MKIEALEWNLSVCKLRGLSQVSWEDAFCFIAKTDDEISLVCRTEYVPTGVYAREDGWKAMRIMETLDFSLTGILAGIVGLLAGHNIPIFAVSTYNTDYFLVKEEYYEDALQILEQEGAYEIIKGIS